VNFKKPACTSNGALDKTRFLGKQKRAGYLDEPSRLQAQPTYTDEAKLYTVTPSKGRAGNGMTQRVYGGLLARGGEGRAGSNQGRYEHGGNASAAHKHTIVPNTPENTRTFTRA
jgi:hypothetical protein